MLPKTSAIPMAIFLPVISACCNEPPLVVSVVSLARREAVSFIRTRVFESKLDELVPVNLDKLSPIPFLIACISYGIDVFCALASSRLTEIPMDRNREKLNIVNAIFFIIIWWWSGLLYNSFLLEIECFYFDRNTPLSPQVLLSNAHFRCSFSIVIASSLYSA